MMARGGWVNTVHGNLELIQGDDARWMARAQALFFELQGLGRIHTFGGIPGDIEPYGFGGVTTRGAVYVVMNPAQTVATITLPRLAPDQPPLGVGRVQFRDAGFTPKLSGNKITLGPGQMAMVGYGAYAAPAYDFGVQDDVVIPSTIDPLHAEFHATCARHNRGQYRTAVQRRAARHHARAHSRRVHPPHLGRRSAQWRKHGQGLHD